MFKQVTSKLLTHLSTMLIILFCIQLHAQQPAQPVEVLPEKYRVEMTAVNDSLYNLFVVDEEVPQQAGSLTGKAFNGLNAQQTELILYRLYNEQLDREAKAKFDLLTQMQASTRLSNGLDMIKASRFDEYRAALKGRFVGSWLLSYGTGEGAEAVLTVSDDKGKLTVKDESGQKIGSLSIKSTLSLTVKFFDSDVVDLPVELSGKSIDLVGTDVKIMFYASFVDNVAYIMKQQPNEAAENKE